MRLVYLLVAFLLTHSTLAQTTPFRKQIDALFKQASPKPQVLLLGTFHFAGEQVDANTTPADLRVNILSPTRQAQVEEVINQIARFKPTKIAIEASPNSKNYIDSVYSAYRKGKFQGDKLVRVDDELYQIGFKLAERLGHSELFPIDAQPFRIRFSPADSLTMFTKYERQSDTTFIYWDKQYTTYSKLQDSLKYQSTVGDYLRFLNEEDTQARSIGRWLITTKKGTNREPIGADQFISRYYNRNLRIYSNIQRLVTSPSDRILVLYGNTHLYILKHLLKASPEFDLADTLGYLK
ncbi:DUF5694 domain-containing protein [Spirosoma radiotolerans]|uniref:Polysaccharide deacetylase n=1 Tax=Spirosoma radiotolerans TaxID=1379870 RepID=A0A0E3ZT80_9BACT|nr:DUF5694 domain-containing protein [Spirosoma radiotolerans]AKD53683.1 hypothetical protein SD10_00975 [Spirosoma radiotolerans]